MYFQSKKKNVSQVLGILNLEGGQNSITCSTGMAILLNGRIFAVGRVAFGLPCLAYIDIAHWCTVSLNILSNLKQGNEQIID